MRTVNCSKCGEEKPTKSASGRRGIGGDLCGDCYALLANASNTISFDIDIKLSREAALSAGYIVFWSGEPCTHGHLAHRYVSGNRCVVCSKLKSKAANRNKLCVMDGVTAQAKRRDIESVMEARRLAKEIAGDFDL